MRLSNKVYMKASIKYANMTPPSTSHSMRPLFPSADQSGAQQSLEVIPNFIAELTNQLLNAA